MMVHCRAQPLSIYDFTLAKQGKRQANCWPGQPSALPTAEMDMLIMKKNNHYRGGLV